MMRVFISWSGEPSRSVAQALRDWLPMVVQHVVPWMSDEDIESGGRWNDQVAAELERADYGIICLTSANLARPWLLFEAGALAKRFDVARVVPLLIDLRPADVTMPLASFQGRLLSEDGMLRLVRDMNAGRDQPLPHPQIDELFAGMWPALEARVRAAIGATSAADTSQAPREAEDLMTELVETVRRVERRMDTLTEADHNFFIGHAQQAFSNELADAVAQLFGYERASQAGYADPVEFASIALRLQALIAEAQEAGLPVRNAYFRDAILEWQRRYRPRLPASALGESESTPDEPEST